MYVERGWVGEAATMCAAMTHLCPFDAVAAQDNHIGAASAKALRPELEKLTNLTVLDLSGTCGDVQPLRTQCARVGDGKERWCSVVFFFACEVLGVWSVY